MAGCNRHDPRGLRAGRISRAVATLRCRCRGMDRHRQIPWRRRGGTCSDFGVMSAPSIWRCARRLPIRVWFRSPLTPTLPSPAGPSRSLPRLRGKVGWGQAGEGQGGGAFRRLAGSIRRRSGSNGPYCDLYGHVPADAPDRRAWLDHGQWGLHAPLGAETPAPHRDPTELRIPGGAWTWPAPDSRSARSMPGIIEPGHSVLTANGETVARLERTASVMCTRASMPC